MNGASSIDPRARPQLIYWFAAFVGTTYFLAARLEFAGADMVAWKGAGVGLLALWAARHADGVEGAALATILTAGAVGDVLLETHGLTVGGSAFFTGHVLATALYARGRWADGWTLVAASAGGVAAVTFWLTGAPATALYAAGLGAMAGAATLGGMGSLVLAGAWLFVVSDLLLFARAGSFAGSAVSDWLVWPTYFGGQLLIAWGGVTTLARRRATT